MQTQQSRNLVRRGIGHDNVPPKYHRWLPGSNRAAAGCRLGFRTSQWEGTVGNAVPAGKLCDTADVAVLIFADQSQDAVAVVELASTTRGKHRDDDV